MRKIANPETYHVWKILKLMTNCKSWTAACSQKYSLSEAVNIKTVKSVNYNNLILIIEISTLLFRVFRSSLTGGQCDGKSVMVQCDVTL